MNQNLPIRIIKRAERERQSEERTAKPPASVTVVAQEKARDAAATITGWISKWQEEKEQSSISALLKLSGARMLNKDVVTE